MSVRLRFAPSPTGPLHIGGVRTALYNYLFAKKHGGKLILRIEDTDSARLVPNAQHYMEEAMKWCGITFDESPEQGGAYAPYVQSQRNEIYNKFIEELLKKEAVYYAFDTPEELDQYRKNYEKEGKVFAYDSSTRLHLKNSLSLPEEETRRLLQENTPYVLRFKIPENQTVEVQDLIRGTFSVNTNTLDDKVLIKTDGTPTYHLANIIDDHTMEISHVIRGEEWLPSLPLHLLLYKAFGWEAPKFAHLPLLLKPEGNGKLSKRDGDKFGFPVFPLQWEDPETHAISMGYREQGYFPEAFINMLALLGWSPEDNKEVLSLEEMIREFDIEKVHKAGARFNIEKNKWFNKEYLLKHDIDELTKKYQNYLLSIGITPSEKDKKIVSLLKERAHFVSDIFSEGKFFYHAPEQYDEKAYQKHRKEDTEEILSLLWENLEGIEWEAEKINAKIHQYAQDKGIGLGKILPVIRLKLVGEMKGPDVPVIMELLGKEETGKRIKAQR